MASVTSVGWLSHRFVAWDVLLVVDWLVNWVGLLMDNWDFLLEDRDWEWEWKWQWEEDPFLGIQHDSNGSSFPDPHHFPSAHSLGLLSEDSETQGDSGQAQN